MYIRKIVIENYKSFYKTEICLQEGLNVILGENNTGKSNFVSIINLLKNKEYKSSINDFNMSFLKQNFNELLEKPPIINIIYEIEHILDYNCEDSAMAKLMPFLIYNETGGFEEIEGENEKEKLEAVINLVYEFDMKFIHEYKEEMKNVTDFECFVKILKKLEDKFSYNFKTITSKDYIDKNLVYKIFEIEKVEAAREISKITSNSKKFLNQKFKEQQLDVIDVKGEITSLVQRKCKQVTTEINNEIDADQDNIGVTNGKNKFISDFEYLGDLSEMFKYELDNVDGDFRLPLDNNGLGYNNLIYIRNLIKEKKDNDYNILIIEEPEAHLHPCMQYKLLKYINSLKNINVDNQLSIRNQIIITTHSTNISANVGFESMILFYSNPIDGILNISATNLIDNFKYNKYVKEDNNDKIQQSLNLNRKHLEKFLDVTRCDLLFSSKIILVEGLAEKLLLPAMFPRLVDEHVSIVEVAGINFNHFVPLCINVGKKVLSITDKDFSYFAEEKIVNNKDIYHYKKFAGLCNLNLNDEKHLLDEHFKEKTKNNFLLITQINGGNTFETELFIDNYQEEDDYEKAKELLKIVCPKYMYNLINDLSYNNWLNRYALIEGQGSAETKKMIEKHLDMFKIEYDNSDDKKEIEKYFFTTLFYHYAKSMKGDLALELLNRFKENQNAFNIPTYIQRGINEWLM